MNPSRIRDPNAVYDAMVRVGEERAERIAAAEMLEETKKTILAQLTLRAAASGEAKTRVMAEQIALASKEYAEHIKAMVEARKEANKAEAHWKAAQAWLEYVRTLEASNRAEMALAGMQRGAAPPARQ